mmetsp:Transcript_15052/g.23285  ORF Transcript_15052/g.23285 Transcript_15052/m.23285 type:complete len:110 (-) Transcript_15052:1271-1600(-)
MEISRRTKLADIIATDILENQNQEVTYWTDRKRIKEEDEKEKFTFKPKDLLNWNTKIKRAVSKKAAFPIDPDLYAKEIESKYVRLSSKWEDIGSETFVSAVYLPAESNG